MCTIICKEKYPFLTIICCLGILFILISQDNCIIHLIVSFHLLFETYSCGDCIFCLFSLSMLDYFVFVFNYSFLCNYNGTLILDVRRLSH